MVPLLPSHAGEMPTLNTTGPVAITTSGATGPATHGPRTSPAGRGTICASATGIAATQTRRAIGSGIPLARAMSTATPRATGTSRRKGAGAAETGSTCRATWRAEWGRGSFRSLSGGTPIVKRREARRPPSTAVATSSRCTRPAVFRCAVYPIQTIDSRLASRLTRAAVHVCPAMKALRGGRHPASL